MDIKMKSKSANIVLSILIFLFTTLMFSTFYFSQIMSVSADGIVAQVSLQELIEASVEYFKRFTEYASSGFSTFIYSLFFYGGFLVMLGVTMIIYLVNYIIVTVKTIQGLAGRDTSKDIIRHILMMITAVAVYVAYLTGIYHQQIPTKAITIGVGPMLMVLISTLLFVICAIIRVSYEDKKKKATRVFKVIISYLAFLGSIILFATAFSYNNLSYNLLEAIVIGFSRFQTPGQEVISYVYNALFLSAIGFIFAGQDTFTKLILHSFGFEVRKKEKQPRDVGTSLITRSILALVFTGGGMALIKVCLEKLNPTYTYEYGIFLMIGAGLAFVSLVLAIIHKIISGPAPKEDENSLDKDKEDDVDEKDSPKSESRIETEPEPEEVIETEPEEELASFNSDKSNSSESDKSDRSKLIAILKKKE